VAICLLQAAHCSRRCRTGGMVAAVKAAGPWGFDVPKGPETTLGVNNPSPGTAYIPFPPASLQRRSLIRCRRTHLYPEPRHVDHGVGRRGRAIGRFRPHRTDAVQDRRSELPRILLLRASVNSVSCPARLWWGEIFCPFWPITRPAACVMPSRRLSPKSYNTPLQRLRAESLSGPPGKVATRHQFRTNTAEMLRKTPQSIGS
jgi:hypothetical protein